MLSPRSACRAGSKAQELLLSVLQEEGRAGFGYCWQHKAGFLLCTQAWVFPSFPWRSHGCPGCAAACLCTWIFFLSNPIFHQKAEIFSAASETQAGVIAGPQPCSEIPPVCCCCCSPHGTNWGWHRLWGSVGGRAPPAPPGWLLPGSKPRTSSREAAEARQVHGSCSVRENAAGAGETGDDQNS